MKRYIFYSSKFEIFDGERFSFINFFLFQNLTPAEMMGLMASFREMCQPRYNLSDEIIDNVNAGQFPENNDLKVENFSFLRKHDFCVHSYDFRI